MAKRPALIKRRPKTVRTTKSEQYIVNQKYLGDEPTFTGELSEVQVARCLSWYGYMCTTADARDYIKTYYKNIGQPAKAKILSRVSDSNIPMTAAWLVRMISRGYKPSGTTMQFISSKLEGALDKAKEDEGKAVQTKAVVSIQDRMRERSHEILGEVEGVIDDHLDSETGSFSFYNWLQSNEIPAAYIPKIVEKLAPRLNEIIDAYDFKSGDLIEAYAYCKKKDFIRMIAFFNMMIDDAERYAGNVKKVRKTRAPRTVSVDKKIKSLKWQKEDTTYKIASVAPEKIIGAQELWTFNTKYKTLTVFRAIDRGGLQVKGTSITNYDEKSSHTRSTGRKSEEYIKRTLEGGKLVLRKIMDELKTEKTLAHRINENTILLRTVS